MKAFILSITLFASGIAVATAQDSGVAYGTITYGTLQPDSGTIYTVPLAPGEEIIGAYPAPPVVQTVPLPPAPITGTLPPGTVSVAPSVDIDRVTGLPRNTSGWSGQTAGPAGIGCFPQGVCAHLNN